jgi:hypothetical protein
MHAAMQQLLGRLAQDLHQDDFVIHKRWPLFKFL